ncbi:MAG: GntP family permease [Paucibacter sp.]|nr:GntP family permease [Roseateles sp.]
MSVLIVLISLAFLMLVAYRGFSVILFAPIAALGAVLFVDPSLVMPMFTGLFMEKLAQFAKLYFPVFLLGAVLGKVIELSGFAKSIIASVSRFCGPRNAVLAIAIVCGILTYGGVSLFVVVFAAYPFAAEMFKRANLPKRLIPATIVAGAATFTMDALPGSPQIQNIIPTTFFKTDAWAAPWLGLIGSAIVFSCSMALLMWLTQRAVKSGEGYGSNHINEPAPFEHDKLPHPLLALAPLVTVAVLNKVFGAYLFPALYGKSVSFIPAVIGNAAPVVQDVQKLNALWSVELALACGILVCLLTSWKTVAHRFGEGSKSAIGGAMLATLNTATEYGYGAVIAALPGFLVVADALKNIPNPLVNEAVTVTTLAGITGSASGGMGIALAAMADTFMANAKAAGIPFEVLHRVASMASGGMDTLPHNGAVITFLAVCGLTHRQAYPAIFGITVIKSLAVFAVIGVFYLTGIV